MGKSLLLLIHVIFVYLGWLEATTGFLTEPLTSVNSHFFNASEKMHLLCLGL